MFLCKINTCVDYNRCEKRRVFLEYRRPIRSCDLLQVAETHRVRDLAQMIADKTGSKIDFISNPRNEAAENELEVKNDKFGNLGVDFKSLDGTLLEEVRKSLCGEFYEDTPRESKKELLCKAVSFKI